MSLDLGTEMSSWAGVIVPLYQYPVDQSTWAPLLEESVCPSIDHIMSRSMSKLTDASGDTLPRFTFENSLTSFQDTQSYTSTLHRNCESQQRSWTGRSWVATGLKLRQRPNLVECLLERADGWICALGLLQKKNFRR